MRERVAGTNIHAETLLATDYLNHFNEVVMTLELLPDMPELLSEAQAWEPKTYVEHFAGSTFSDRDLAIEAYRVAPTRFRRPFERTIVQLSRVVLAAVRHVADGLDKGDAEMVRGTVEANVPVIRRLIDHASGIIHGSETTMHQSEIDHLLGR